MKKKKYVVDDKVILLLDSLEVSKDQNKEEKPEKDLVTTDSKKD